MRPPAYGSLRHTLIKLGTVNGSWHGPPGSPVDRLARGQEVVLGTEFLASHLHPDEQPATLNDHEAWRLVGDHILEPVEGS